MLMFGVFRKCLGVSDWWWFVGNVVGRNGNIVVNRDLVAQCFRHDNGKS